jgi:hypothetical protein
MKKYLVLAVLAGCATQIPRMKDSEDSPPSTPTAPSSGYTRPTTSTEVWKTPTLVLPLNPSKSMQEARELVREHANTDGFYGYVRSKVKHLAGGDETNVEQAIARFRTCLNNLGEIPVVWGTYMPFSRAIGGWDGTHIRQNARLSMTSVERAGHWVHELTHACDFNHLSNDIVKYPIIKESWPYQAGYAFEDYLTEKRRTEIQLAGEL